MTITSVAASNGSPNAPVFITHNGKQKPWVRRVVAQWRALGLNVFFDEDCIPPGADVVSALESAVSRSRHVVLVLSPAALESRWVAMEIAMAAVDDPDARDRRLIPLVVEPVDIRKVGLSLRRLNILDLTDPDQRQARYAYLLRSLGLDGAELPPPPEFDPLPAAPPLREEERDPLPDDGAAVRTATARARMELSINRNLDEFTPQQQAKLFEAIKALLETDDEIVLRGVRKGSVILTLDLSPEDAERLFWAVQRGELSDFGVTSATEPEVVEDADEPEPEERWRGETRTPPHPVATLGPLPAGRGELEAGAVPLTLAQAELWTFAAGDPGRLRNHIVRLRLAGTPDVDTLELALGEVVRRHHVLRTVFFETSAGVVMQAVDPAPAPLRVPLRVEDATTDPERGMLLVTDSLIAVSSFDLRAGLLLRGILVRVAPEEHLLGLVVHPLAADAASLRILVWEVFTSYQALRLFPSAMETRTPPREVQYLTVAAIEHAPHSARDRESSRTFWRERLPGVPALPELPADRANRGGLYAGDLSAVEAWFTSAGELVKLANREGVTLFEVLLSAYAVLVSRLSGADGVLLGAVVPGRSWELMRTMIGCFERLVPVSANVSAGLSFARLAQHLAMEMKAAEAHLSATFEEMTGRPGSWMRVGFALRESWDRLTVPGLEVTVEGAESPLPPLDLCVEHRLRDEVLQISFYPADLWNGDAVRLLSRLYLHLLHEVAADPDRPVSRLPLSDPYQALTEQRGWNETERPYPRTSIHARFARQVRVNSYSVALVWDGGEMTYAELDRRANRLANHLRDRGVLQGQPVGVVLERSPELIVAILAVLKAGGAYVPIDPAYPAERIAFMIRDADAWIAITRSEFADRLAHTSRHVVLLDAHCDEIESRPDGSPELPDLPDSAAYVMYTSGSTGTPKGVVVPHRAVLRLVVNGGFAYLGPWHAWLQLAPVSFDASTLEIWAPLLNGGRLALYPPVPPTTRELGEFIRRYGVTSAWLTAGLFHYLVEEEVEALSGLRQLLTGGDVISVSHARRVMEAHPGLRLINGYGPTENTTFSSCRTVTPADVERRAIPIGAPIANSTAWVLDESMQPLPPYVPGELYVGGDGLARGYLNRPSLTAERFVPDPFSDGGRLYRTGDRARRLPDGTIEFLGRLDAQVKVRGFRIEPGEIEAVLESHPDVRACVVVVREDAPGDRRLVAYVVPSGRVLEIGELRDWIRERLPDYMVPAAFVALDALPLTPNGKVDRRALPAPDAPSGPADEPPLTEVEAHVARIWRELVGVDAIAPHQSFFELGGNSLLVVRVVSRVAKEFGIQVPVRVIFEAPRLDAFAAWIEAEVYRSVLSEPLDVESGERT